MSECDREILDNEEVLANYGLLRNKKLYGRVCAP
jgi:hypothetical protein